MDLLCKNSTNGVKNAPRDRKCPNRLSEIVKRGFWVTTNSGDPNQGVGWIKTNQGVAVCIGALVLMLLVYLALSDWAYQELRDGFRLGFFTFIASTAMLACAIALAVDKHRTTAEPAVANMAGRDWLIIMAFVAGCYVYFFLAWNVDFLLVTPVFIAGGMYVLGVRPLLTAAIAGVVASVTIFGLFWAIQIELPTILLSS